MLNRTKIKWQKYQGVIKYKQTFPDSPVVWDKDWASPWWLSEDSCEKHLNRVWGKLRENPLVEIICVYIHENDGLGFRKVWGDFSEVACFGEKLVPVQEFHYAKVWGADGCEFYKFESVRDRNSFVNVINNSTGGHAMKMTGVEGGLINATWSASFQQFRTADGTDHKARGLCYKRI